MSDIKDGVLLVCWRFLRDGSMRGTIISVEVHT